MKYLQYAGLALIGLGMGCSTTSVYKVQPEPGFQSTDIHKVMIISVNKTPATRMAVEDEFVRRWSKQWVTAVASHNALPPGTPLEKAHIAPIAREQGFDYVLASRLLGVQKIDPNIRGQEFDVEASSVSGNMSQYFDAVVASPQYSEDYQLAAASANLYQVATEKKVWSATMQILVQHDLPANIKDYVKAVLKNLYK